MNKYTPTDSEENFLMDHLLPEFRGQDRKLYRTDLLPSDHKKPLAYLAANAFKDVQEYRNWLTEGHPDLDGRAPVSLLAEDPDSAQAKSVLFKHILERVPSAGQMKLALEERP